MMEERRTNPFLVGCAGWSIPAAASEQFPQEGSHLQRYAAVMPAVEINTSFYRPHRPATYARWRESVPAAFRFSVKMPKEITHALRLRDTRAATEKFIGEVSFLEEKLGCLLVQLPPRMRYEPDAARDFFAALRELTETDVVCEPRHATWFTPEVDDMLARYAVSYVIADPVIAPIPRRQPDGSVVYLRLHGSPEMYHSAYATEDLERLACRLECAVREGRTAWCVFDNTASGAAVSDALALLARVYPSREIAAG